MRRTLIAAAFALAQLGGAEAAVDCSAMQDQNSMNQCAEDNFQKSDAALNGLYKQITERLAEGSDTSAKGLLVKSQRAWVGFRDAECEFQTSGSEGGSIQPMLSNLCLDDLTQKRIADFKKYLACEEGDLSCPVPGPG